jgi:hypothetical protein
MIKPEDIGKGNRLRFAEDTKTYYSIRKHPSNKTVLVDDGKGNETWKAISKIIQIDNKKLGEQLSEQILRMQKLAGIIK